MAVLVITKASFGNGEVIYPEGDVWDVDPHGNLEVFNGNNKIGTHASGEWSNVRTVELAKAGPGRPFKDNPQAWPWSS